MRGFFAIVFAGLAVGFGAIYVSVIVLTNDKLTEIELFETLFSQPFFTLPDANPVEDADLGRMACRADPLTDYMQAGLSIAETFVARVPDGGAQVATVDDVILAADRAVRHVLACSPTSGEAWFRLALLTAYAEGWNADTLDLIINSNIYGAHEGPLVRRRLRAVSVPPGLADPMASSLEALLAQDRSVILQAEAARSGR